MGQWPRYVVLSIVIAVVFVFFRTREESEIATQRAELDRERFAQQMDEARLQMLQAQIEPHFLFNTLANVRRLYQSEPSVGETMLDNLMRYLAVALPQMRANDTTIGREAILIESFLTIQRIRMGQRLSFEIDIPESLRDIRIPPLMLLTLVENAIKHGLNPLPEGGMVRVSAALEGREIRIRVTDTGQGFTKSSGGGTGLANTRARLAAVYGPAARFALTLNQPRGVTAMICVPCSVDRPGAAA
jgi:sensor histidine kinase YesM